MFETGGDRRRARLPALGCGGGLHYFHAGTIGAAHQPLSWLRVRQFIFISSASKAPSKTRDRITSSRNPRRSQIRSGIIRGPKSRAKTACCARCARRVFPAWSLFARNPGPTAETVIPLAVACHGNILFRRHWTACAKGNRMIVPGDGSSALGHGRTALEVLQKGLSVGLFGNPATIGHAFHITSDEVLSWDQIYQVAAAAAGVRDLKLVHIASDFIAASPAGSFTGGLIGDKACSVVMDNAKIKLALSPMPQWRDRLRRDSTSWKHCVASTPILHEQLIDREADAEVGDNSGSPRIERGLEVRQKQGGRSTHIGR